MINLNDGTNEGFRHRTLPIAAVQFHPEASPGPFDARRLFAQWLAALTAALILALCGVALGRRRRAGAGLQR